MNESLKSGGDETSLTKNGVCVQTGGIEIYALFTLVCGNILSIIGKLVRVLYVLVYLVRAVTKFVFISVSRFSYLVLSRPLGTL